jgi:hypothetical protein
LAPHINEIDSRLRPGLSSLTWSSMNIDAFKDSVHSALKVCVWCDLSIPRARGRTGVV